jgi:hypothetical protein
MRDGGNVWRGRVKIWGLTPEDFPPQRTPDACEECLVERTFWVVFANANRAATSAVAIYRKVVSIKPIKRALVRYTENKWPGRFGCQPLNLIEMFTKTKLAVAGSTPVARSKILHHIGCLHILSTYTKV